MKKSWLTSFLLLSGLALTISFASGCKHASNPSADAQPSNAPNAAQDNASAQPGNTSNGTAGTPSNYNGSTAQSAPASRKITLTVAAGTDVDVRVNETINTKTANVGDSFTGVLNAPLKTRGGETFYAKGTSVSGTVVSSKGQGRFAGAGVLAIELKEIGGTRVAAKEYVVSAKGKGKRTAALIGGGAGLGALIGGLAGGGKGAAIGGLAGAGAGTAGAGFTGNKQLVIPSESLVTFEITEPLSKTIER